MIEKHVPRFGRKLQDLILDRNEFEKQRFPKSYEVDPAHLFLADR